MRSEKHRMLLLALQDDLALRSLPDEAAAAGTREWVYLGEDSAWRVGADEVLSDVASRRSITNELHCAATQLRDPYIEWIGELSQANDSLDWWASPLAAKNPYDGLFARICLLRVAAHLLRDGVTSPTLVISPSRALLSETERVAQDRGLPVRWLSRPAPRFGPRRIARAGCSRLGRSYRRLFRAIRQEPPPGARFSAWHMRVLARLGAAEPKGFAGDDTFLLATWADTRNVSPEGHYQDPHLGPLADLLRARGCRVSYLARVLPTVPFEPTAARLVRTNESIFFPESIVEASSWNACEERARRFNPRIPADTRVGDVPATALAREHVDETRDAHACALVYEPLIAGLAARGVEPGTIVHTCEGHAWEQVLAWCVRRYMPRTRIVAYENVNFSRLALSMYPAPSEFGRRPLPDRVVTNGEFYRTILLGEGYPPEMVRTGCALRHVSIWERERVVRTEAVKNGRVRILAATAIGFGEAVELAAKTANAFGGDPRYDVLIKCHPTLDPRQVASGIGRLAQHSNVTFVTADVGELLQRMDVLLYTYSVVVFEALRHGVTPVCVRLESVPSLGEFGTGDTCWVASSPKDLREVVTQICGMSELKRRDWQRRALEIVRSVLAPPTPACVEAFLAEETGLQEQRA